MAKHKTFSAEDGLVGKDLVRYGLDHIAAGFKLFSSHPFFFDSAGYLVHIGYECVLKGWVMELHSKYEGRHSIEFFRSLIPQLDAVILSKEFNETIRLIDSYEQLRYPSRIDPREVGTEEMDAIKRLVDHTVSLLPCTLVTTEREAHITKGGRILSRKPIS